MGDNENIKYWRGFEKMHRFEAHLYWSAFFYSVDQRNNFLYYVLSIHKEKDGIFEILKKFGVRLMDPLHLKSFEEKWQFISEELSRLAKKNETNIPESVLWKGIGHEKIDEM
ncbi:MAG: hypothetical protein GF383_10335 [Candidatus Lokiarchaeota archaeon]|nr:hypothetical protein [Candidatus Lokiarchaeota archaeon]